MRIAFITEHCCIRVLKEADVLRDMGIEVVLIAHTPRMPQLFHFSMQYTDGQMLEKTVKLLEDKIDVWVVHNEPTWMVSCIRNVLPEAKIVLNYHDSNYWRYDNRQAEFQVKEPIFYPEEDVAVDCANAFIVQSITTRNELKTRTDKPIAILPSAVPKKYFQIKPSTAPGICYEGGHHNPGHNDTWRDNTEMYRQLISKHSVYAYSPDFTNKKIAEHYSKLGVYIRALSYDQLIQTIGSHTWNLVGNITHHKVWDYVISNKLFDGIAAGLPAMILNNRESEEIVKTFDIGITGQTVDEVLENYHLHIEKRANLIRCRDKLCMENFISNSINLYNYLISDGKTKFYDGYVLNKHLEKEPLPVRDIKNGDIIGKDRGFDGVSLVID